MPIDTTLVRIAAEISDLKQQMAAATGHVEAFARRTEATGRSTTAALSTASRGFTVLSQSVSRAGDIAHLFGADISGVERALFTATSTMATATQAVRVFQGGLVGLLAAIGPVTLALTALSFGLSKFVSDMRAAEVSIWDVIRAGTTWQAQQNKIARETLANMGRSIEQTTAGMILAMNASKGLGNASEDLHQRLGRLRDAEARLSDSLSQGTKAMRGRADSLTEVARAREAALAREMDAIVQFNVWQRQQWEAAAEFRKAKFLEEAAARVAALALEIDDIVRFNIWQRQQWEAAAARRRDAFMALPSPAAAATESAEEVIKNAKLIAEANKQSAIEYLRAWLTAFEATADASDATTQAIVARVLAAMRAIAASAQDDLVAQLKKSVSALEEFIEAARDALGGALKSFFKDVVSGAKTFGDAIRDFLGRIVDFLIDILAQLAAKAILVWIGLGKGGVIPGGLSFGSFQGGGIISQPTLAVVGEGSQAEAVVPLPDNRSIPVKFMDGLKRQEQEIVTHIYVVFDREQLAQMQPTRDEIVGVIELDLRDGGPIARTVRALVK